MAHAGTPTDSDSRRNGIDTDELREAAKTAAGAATSALKETSSRARTESETALQDARDQIETAQQSALSAVRRNPGMAVLGAVGIGVLLGLALRGRH